jgi:hypothetical protein
MRCTFGFRLLAAFSHTLIPAEESGAGGFEPPNVRTKT